MADFNERENTFEAKYAHDAELQFKTTSRAVRLFAAWVAEQMGMTGDNVKMYADRMVAFDLKEEGINDVLTKAKADFAEAGMEYPLPTLEARFADFMKQAKEQMAA